MDHKAEFIRILNTVRRDGIQELIKFLEGSDFFRAPCSTKFHLCRPGGLVEHSLTVYHLLFEKYDHLRFVDFCNRPKIEIDRDSIIIAGLLHDVCKIDFYKEGGESATPAQISYLSKLYPLARDVFKQNLPDIKTLCKEHASILIDWLKNRPSEPMPELPVTYSVDDNFPLGHGEKSVSIIQEYIRLTPEERLAIRWHMGAFGLSYGDMTVFREAQKIPLVTLLHTADLEASNILEAERNEGKDFGKA
uniref:Putative HD domain-containing protein n=1 Tax=viral metagenome TaxID=1070528 RepID=A0A6M3K5F1_9ZZZZ